MIFPCGTFDYVVTVPVGTSSSPWHTTTRDPVTLKGDSLLDDRLVGLTPKLSIADAGSTPNPGYTKGVWRPYVLRSCIVLEAANRSRATARSVSFHIDRHLTSALKPGDLLYMSRTPGGGVGLSVVRDDELLYAVGAVTAVPLATIEARIPLDLIDLAEAPLRERDPEFEFPEIPLEISGGKERHLLLQGRCRIGRYEISVIHGLHKATSGGDECASISRDDTPDTAAAATATLLDADGLEITQW